MDLLDVVGRDIHLRCCHCSFDDILPPSNPLAHPRNYNNVDKSPLGIRADRTSLRHVRIHRFGHLLGVLVQ